MEATITLFTLAKHKASSLVSIFSKQYRAISPVSSHRLLYKTQNCAKQKPIQILFKSSPVLLLATKNQYSISEEKDSLAAILTLHRKNQSEKKHKDNFFSNNNIFESNSSNYS